MKEVAIKTNASISFSFSPKVLVVFKYILNANRANRIPAINEVMIKLYIVIF